MIHMRDMNIYDIYMIHMEDLHEDPPFISNDLEFGEVYVE